MVTIAFNLSDSGHWSHNTFATKHGHCSHMRLELGQELELFYFGKHGKRGNRGKRGKQ